MQRRLLVARNVITHSRFQHHQPNLSSYLTNTIFRTRAHHSHIGHQISPIQYYYSWRSKHSISTILRSSLSQPIVARHFALTSRNAFVNRFYCFPRVHFHRQNFNYGSNLSSWRSWFYRLTPTDLVLGLIIANVAVFLLWRIKDEKFMINNFTISLNNIKSGRLHTLITNAFSHVDVEHIISNMIGLYFFGVNIGSNFGTEFLLKLYLAGAVGGSVFFLVHQAYKAQTEKILQKLLINMPFPQPKPWISGRSIINPSMNFAMGASGAVNAIMLLNIFLFPKATLYLNFIIPVPAVLLGIFLIGKDILSIVEGDGKISGSAHLGGAAVAAIAWTKLRKGRFY